MAAEYDVHHFLNSLLVTDRQALTFLHLTVLNPQSVVAPEQALINLVKHVQENQGNTPRKLRQWLGKLGSLQRSHQLAVIRLAGFYHDKNLKDLFLGVLKQLGYVAVHPATVRALAQTMGASASQGLTTMLWSTPTHQWHLRETAILRELGRLGWTSAVDHLIRALKVPYENPARAAAWALSRFEPDEVLSRLMDLVETVEDVRQAAGAAEALGLLGDPRALAVLERASRVANPEVACAAAVAMANLGDAHAEGILVRMAEADQGHAHAEMRARAMGALGVLGKGEASSEASVNALVRGLGDSQPEVRSAAAGALGEVGVKRAAPFLASVLKKEVSPLVRSALIHGLGRLGNTESVSVLLDSLRKESTGVKVEVLNALSYFSDPSLAKHISPYRASRNADLMNAANRALRRLLYRPFAWPVAAPVEEGGEVRIPLYALGDARDLLLPPAPARAEPGFFARLFGGVAPVGEIAPMPVGELLLTSKGVRMTLDSEVEASWEGGMVTWERRFSVHVTREPIQAAQEGDSEDIGVHFTLRQRGEGVGVSFETVAVSLWCAPSEAVGRLSAKSERLACMDPHQADPLLAALRYYLEVHGEPLPFVVMNE